MSASASLSKSESLKSVLNDEVMARAALRQNTAAQTSTATNITANPFFKAVMDPSIAAEAKVEAITRLMTTTLDSKKDRETVQAYEEFREWLSAQSTELSKQVASLMDVDTLAEIQDVIKDLGGGLLDFKDKMSVVMGFIDSIHQLNSSGRMLDVLKDIRTEKEELEKISAEVAQADEEIARHEVEILRLKMMNANLEREKSLFGFGPTKKSALQEIARNEQAVLSAEGKIGLEKAKKQELNARKRSSVFTGEDAAHRENLRKLLDFSNDETRELMASIRDTAIGFVDSAQDRTGSLRTRFTAIADQIFRVEEQNSGMLRAYAIMNEGLAGAAKANTEMRGSLDAPEGDETTLQRLAREDKLRAADTHAEMLKRSEADTMTVYTDLSKQAVTVDTMKQGVTQQIDEARRLNVRGVASTADQIATVLTAVSSAALNQASMSARITMDEMRAETSGVMHREAIRVAMGYEQLNDQLISIAQEAADLNEVQEAATGIVRSSLETMTSRVEAMRRNAEQLQEAHRARQAIASTLDGEPVAEGAAEKPAADQPFSFSQI